MLKKVIASLMAASMALSLSACSSSASDTTNQAAGSQTDSSTTDTTSEQINYFGFDEPTTVKIGISYAAASDFSFYGGETVEDNAWMDLYKSNNIIPEIMYDVDPSQASTKLNTAIMSGDYPDVFKIDAADYQNYIESGAIADITEVYEKYATDELKEYMNFDGGLALDSVTVNGKLYGLPKVNDTLGGVNVMWIRQDWLDNLGLSIPTTMEELKEVAHAFTYEDPDGNGQNDTYGIAFDGVNVINSSVGNMAPFFEGYGIYLGADGLTYVYDESGNIQWGAADSEKMKAALQMLQDMYADGSIARDFITMDDQSVFSETGAGHAGIWFGPNWGAMDPSIHAVQNDINARMVAAAIPTAYETPTKAYASATASSVYCVSSQCENPEMLIKLWNLSVHYCNAKNCTAEEFNMYYGDSKNYSGWKTSIIDAGNLPNNQETYELLKEAMETGDTSQLSTKQLENYTSIKTYVDAVAAGSFDPTNAEQQRGLSLYTVYTDPLNPWTVLTQMIKNDDYEYAAYNGIPSEDISANSATLRKLLCENIIKIITGDSVDTYDAFLQTWYAMGGQDAIDEATAAVS